MLHGWGLRQRVGRRDKGCGGNGYDEVRKRLHDFLSVG
jgi:hypothetical protein